MKPKDYLAIITDKDGWIATPHIHKVLRKNSRNTAREEAIAHEVIKQANPRENISGSHPWGPEEKWVYVQLWVHPKLGSQWRDVPTSNEPGYTIEDTQQGELPIPDAVRQPAAVPMDLQARVREVLGNNG